MTTRRELLKIASALGLAGAAPTVAERIAAAQILEQPGPSRMILNPSSFSSHIADSIENGLEHVHDDLEFLNDWYQVVCPTEGVAYKQAHKRLEAFIRGRGHNCVREGWDYDEATFNLILAMYNAGIRHGAAYENLRRSVVGELVMCRACWGQGITKDESVCQACAGNGTVVLKDGER
jgi:hypothetical protein